jgi:hypothetical protein
MKSPLLALMRIPSILPLAGLVVTLLISPSSQGQGVQISSLTHNGTLSWTNTLGTNAFSVEWAPTLDGPWLRNWHSLESFVLSNANRTNSTSVPMFYRVFQGFTTATLRGAWLSIDPAGTNNHYYVVQSDGVITESSEMNLRTPPGFCELTTTNWTVSNFNYSINLLYENAPVRNYRARSASAGVLVLEQPTGTFWYRASIPSSCAGQWSGVLTEDSTVPGVSYEVSLNVNDEGWVSQVVGWPEVVTGRLYGRPSPGGGFDVAGGFRTGDSGAYRRVHLSGKLTGNRLEAVYWTAEPAVKGIAVFTRQ